MGRRLVRRIRPFGGGVHPQPASGEQRRLRQGADALALIATRLEDIILLQPPFRPHLSAMRGQRPQHGAARVAGQGA